MKSLVGQVVNFRYEILEKTGEGSFFTVYRTRDKVMNRLVAVKVLKPEFSGDPEFSERLVTQARLAVPLSHPNLTKVYEAEVAPDAVYIAEEHVRGIDLKERIRRISPFTVSSAVDVTILVTQAVDYLHRNGIIHGDLRPQKILMGPEGEVKLTGVGMALALADHEDRRSLALMRAPHYSAPELFEGRRPDERSDVYAIGVILYEMLTGVLPFDADTAIGVAMKHARDPIPSARYVNAGVPRAIEGIIFKALAKDPEGRYQTARQLLADLRSVQDSLRVGKPLSWSPEDSPASSARPEVQEPPEREESIWKGLGKAALVIGLSFLLVFTVYFYVVVRGAPPDITVPDVTGMTVDAAQARLTQLGLHSDVARQDYSDKYDEGQIYFTDPQAGIQVKKGSSIDLYVSKGSRNIRIPAVTGMSQPMATEVMQRAGFLVKAVKQDNSDTVPAGDVISQRPSAGSSVDRNNATVTLTVSLGPAPPPAEPPPPPAPTPDTGSYNTTETPPSGTGDSSLRKFNIRFTLPAEGTTKHVQIVVKDDNGEWTALDDTYNPGDVVATTIEVHGKPVEIRTYIDGTMVNKQEK